MAYCFLNLFPWENTVHLFKRKEEKKISLLEAHCLKSNCNQRVNTENPILVVQEYRQCKKNGEIQQIRKDNKGSMKGITKFWQLVRNNTPQKLKPVHATNTKYFI